MDPDDEHPQAHDPDVRAQAAAQYPVAAAAFAWIRAMQDGDVAGAWRVTDPLLRRAVLARQVAPVLRERGVDPGQVLEQIADVDELWSPVSSLIAAGFTLMLGAVDLTHAGIGAAPRVVAPDTEILYLHPDVRDLPGGMWLPDTRAEVLPLLMRYTADTDTWRVANIGSEELPTVG